MLFCTTVMMQFYFLKAACEITHFASCLMKVLNKAKKAKPSVRKIKKTPK